MAKRVEGHPGKRFLRVTESQRVPVTTVAAALVDGVLKNAGFEGFATPPISQDAPRSVELKRGFGLGEYPNLHFGESRRIAWAMQELGAESGQGTSFNGKAWKLDSVRIDRKGREHVIHLGRWPLGWEGPVKRAHKRDIRAAKRLMGKDTNITAMSTLKKQNPIRLALAREKAEAKALESVDKSATVNGWFGWRANLIAQIAEANPERAANGILARFLKPGQSRGETFGQLHTMLLQIADEQLDPADAIHGPFEAGVKKLQQFQRGIGGALLTSIAGDIPWFNKVTNYMINANKFASRDAHAEMTPQGIARVARRMAVIDRYGKFYAGKTTGPGLWKRFRQLAIYPPDSLVEQAMDRRMQQGNIAKLAKVQAVLTAEKWSTPLLGIHQQVVAEEFMRAYNAPAPQLEILTHAGMQSATNAADKARERAIGTAGRVGEVAKKVTTKAAGLMPRALRRRQREAVEPVADPRQALHEAIQAYGGKPMSIKQQAEALLAHADAILEVPMYPIEIVLWERAIAYAEHIKTLSEIATSIVGPEAADATPEAEIA